MTNEELSEALAKVNPVAAENRSPWYVQVMLGVCAWIAGLLLLLFVVLTVVAGSHGESWGVLLTLGVMACAGSALMYRAVNEASAFGSQFALAMSIAGQTGVTVGLGGLAGPRAALWGMLAVEIAMILAVRNRLHRVLVTVLAVMAWALAMHDVLFRDIPGVSLFSRQHEVVYDSSALPVVLWIAMWTPIAYGAFWLVRNEAQWMAAGRERLLRPVMQGLVAGLSVAPLATHPSTFWMAMGMGPTQIVRDGSAQATALWPLLAMFLAILAVALAFTLQNRALMGLGILFALLEIGGFYYVLGTTLLVKSLIMIALGVVLLSVAQVFAQEPAA
jgi:uncharacterized membrane protein